MSYIYYILLYIYIYIVMSYIIYCYIYIYIVMSYIIYCFYIYIYIYCYESAILMGATHVISHKLASQFLSDQLEHRK